MITLKVGVFRGGHLSRTRVIVCCWVGETNRGDQNLHIASREVPLPQGDFATYQLLSVAVNPFYAERCEPTSWLTLAEIRTCLRLPPGSKYAPLRQDIHFDSSASESAAQSG